MIILLGALLAWVGATQDAPAAAETSVDRHLLILNSYHPQYAWTDALVRGALDELGDSLPDENVHVEYMDARRMLDDEPYLDAVGQLLTLKYRSRLPHVILASDDGATRFLLERGGTLFPGVPIVFCGINSIPQAELEAVPGVTGIMEGMEIEGNLRLIERLHPGVRRIVMLADRSSLGRGMTATARAAPASTTSVEHVIWDDFTLPELRDRMAAAGPDTAFLMLAIHRDRAGAYFSFARDLPALTAATRAPVYGMFGMLLGTGVVGGLMNDSADHGRAAAAIVRRVLAGERADDIAIVPKAVYSPRFDWRALQRFEIDVDRLPPGSHIMARPFSVLETYRTVIWSVVGALLALIVAVAGLVYLVVRMRTAERALAANYRALQRARRAEVVGQLAGGVAHDFNNLLTPILISARFLRRQVTGAPAADVETIQTAAERAQELARQLLSLGRDEPLALRPVDLSTAMPVLIGLLQKSVGTAIELAIEPGTSRAVVEADRCQLERVIVNLLMNARDAAANDRPLRVAVRIAAVDVADRTIERLRAGRYVRIRVTDNGVGMDAATAEHIFEPFFTTKEPGRGAGLGLSTVQAIVRQHGGIVTVESTPGRGSRFDVYLRSSEGSVDEPEPAAEETAETPSGSRPLESPEPHMVVRWRPPIGANRDEDDVPDVGTIRPVLVPE